MSYKIHNNYKAVINSGSFSLNLLFKSVLVGLAAGLASSFYRVTLMNAENLSIKLYAGLRSHRIWVPAAFIALALSGFLTGKLVTKYRMIAGSGIPQVKGQIMGYFKIDWFSTLTAKFIGGAFSFLAGLSLGREGPSIQLGACVAQGLSDKLASSRTEKKVLIASGASAGLSAAFNAPLAGAVFSLEEIFKYFSPAVLLSTMMAAVVADFISKTIFGTLPVFRFDIQGIIPLKGYWLLFILGGVLGISGAVYNFVLLHTQKLYKKMKWIKKEFRPEIPFILAGILGIFFPLALCGGNAVIAELKPSSGVGFLLLILLIKFLFSMLSFGSGAPGGIFFPLLVMGATIGAVFGNIAVNFFGFDPSLY
jgi:H+/Cl- antiporter ClcA